MEISRSILPTGKHRHVFFLYRTEGQSRNFIMELWQTLEQIGYVCGCHEQEFVIGKSYLSNLENCIKTSAVIVPWISEEFLTSPYCMKDLDIACHYFDHGVMVMPLLYELQLHDIPEILQRLVCLNVSANILTWRSRFLDSLSRHIDQAREGNSAEEEVHRLIDQFASMSTQAKILFSLKFSGESKFDIIHMIGTLQTKEVLELFHVQFVENNCFHMVQNYYRTGVLESECERCILLSINSKVIALCEHSVSTALSRVCATQLSTIVGNSNGHKKVCAVLEYIFNDLQENGDNKLYIFHLCYENNYFTNKIGSATMKATNLRVYDESDKLIRRSCLGLTYM
ncbi:uncharacterized protein LOC127731109 [Mytilus californianus]|uniref:uncharacterized protein LOC127731109 n=1 Tax=Mytilus californianus TaxID=6549 RepID=UPI002247B61E|nr:uncharacterized protein LOC127731109 [Mytilus californianus]